MVAQIAVISVLATDLIGLNVGTDTSAKTLPFLRKVLVTYAIVVGGLRFANSNISDRMERSGQDPQCLARAKSATHC